MAIASGEALPYPGAFDNGIAAYFVHQCAVANVSFHFASEVYWLLP